MAEENPNGRLITMTLLGFDVVADWESSAVVLPLQSIARPDRIGA